jgi:deoxyribodipyrimidine photo-lyase
MEKFADVVWEPHHGPDGGDAETLRKWKSGQTGVPIVDAAMRCLNEMGWLHNRMRSVVDVPHDWQQLYLELRMIVAMFLAKHLMIDWRVGEKVQHFLTGHRRTFDSPLSSTSWNNSSTAILLRITEVSLLSPTVIPTEHDPGWQWCASTGVDACPYFRIFNPYSQSEKVCDPQFF